MPLQFYFENVDSQIHILVNYEQLLSSDTTGKKDKISNSIQRHYKKDPPQIFYLGGTVFKQINITTYMWPVEPRKEKLTFAQDYFDGCLWYGTLCYHQYKHGFFFFLLHYLSSNIRHLTAQPHQLVAVMSYRFATFSLASMCVIYYVISLFFAYFLSKLFRNGPDKQTSPNEK